MSQKPLSFYGQLNFTEIKAALKSGHIKAQKIQTQKGEQVVFNINVWVNEEADQFNNNASVQMTLKKEAFDGGIKNTYYIGNLNIKFLQQQKLLLKILPMQLKKMTIYYSKD